MLEQDDDEGFNNDDDDFVSEKTRAVHETSKRVDGLVL